MKVELPYELVVYGKRHMNSKEETLFMTDVTLELESGDSYSYGELLDLVIQECSLDEKINPNTIDSVTLSRIQYDE